MAQRSNIVDGALVRSICEMSKPIRVSANIYQLGAYDFKVHIDMPIGDELEEVLTLTGFPSRVSAEMAADVILKHFEYPFNVSE